MKKQKQWIKLGKGKYKCLICSKVYTAKGIGTHIWRAHGKGRKMNF